MKQRFSSLDVKVITNELAAAIVDLRVSNIYDLSSRIFLFKFAKPGKREQLLVDSGFRCHLTSFSRTAATAPSAFVSRLRKYLKSRRVTRVRQIGTDRVIEITFGDGHYRLFLEFFAAGNIILADADLNVVALLRQVNEGDEDVDVKLGSKYVLDAKQNVNGVPPITRERIEEALKKAVERASAAGAVGGKKAKRAKGADDLRKALSAGFPEFPSHLLEHVFKETGLDAGSKAEAALGNNEQIDKITAALERASLVFNGLETEQSKGYIIAKLRSSASEEQTKPETTITTPPSRDALLYDDFHPFRPAQFENIPGIHILEFDSFNQTVDEFYSSIESQKLETRLTEREQAAQRKIQVQKDEHEKRLGALHHVQELHIRKAQTIEANTHRVEEVCAAVNGLIGQGMDWVDMGKLIENEQKRNNVVAQMIKLPLKLEENTVTILLDEPTFDEGDESDEEDKTDDEDDEDSDEEPAAPNKSAPAAADKRLAIDIDLALTPWANAGQYYDQKKTAAVKEQKTMQASTKALASAEKKIEADLKKGLKQEKAAMRPARKQFWFEKFLYFISSDGYLVIGGKDVQQNELLYRRYLKKGDIYVHADLQGASSVIVKNNPRTPDSPIPPSTLSQAGALAVCSSSAWDSKALMGAWWVNSDQVSKTTATGEYLTTGGFTIKGKKNLLPPSQLLLGFGVVWLISEESRANHGKHRVERTENTLDGGADVLARDAQGLSIEEQDPADDDSEPEAVPDPEDAADDAEERKQEAEEDDDDDDDDDDDKGMDVKSTADQDDEDHDEEDQDTQSAAASDNEAPRANPLQSHGQKVDVDDEIDKEESDDEDEVRLEDPDVPLDSTRSSTPSGQQPKQKQQQLARGKRSKAKRAKKKYADQDDEDRALAMELLGSTKAQQRAAAEAEAKAAREAKAEADRERRRAQHAKAAEREKLRIEKLEKGEEVVDELSKEQIEQERKELLDIDRLVPIPQPGDELLAAIPVVAPWTAMTRQKYKIKLQPGSVKKGKAVKEIIGLWTGLGTRGPKVMDETNREREKVWRRELDLLKEWRFEEVVGVLPVKGVRVMQGGGLLGGVGGNASGSNKGKAGGGAKGKGKSGGGRKGR